MMTSGSWRRNERRPEAKVSSIFGLTCVCEMPSSWYSTGSSTVRMLLSGELISDRQAYSVVVLPEPVGPVTSRMPCGRLMMPRTTSSMSAGMPMSPSPSSTELRSSKRIVMRSPVAVGTVATRMSTSLPAILRRMRPSCGSRFSAMLRPAMILMRATIEAWNFLGARLASRSAPSTRYRTITSRSPGSTWMSDARSLTAWNMSELTQRMMGASSLASSMSTSSSAWPNSSSGSSFLCPASSSAPPRRRA